MITTDRDVPLAVRTLLLAIVAALYLWNLGGAPAYLGGDEAHFGVQAHSLARSGRDLSGHAWPLLINLSDPIGTHDPKTTTRWYQPTLFYLTACILRFAPLTEATIRAVPALIGGLLNPLLMYAVALRLFRKPFHAVMAAVMLVLSPRHLILSRQA